MGDYVGRRVERVDIALAGKRYVRKPNESSVTVTQLLTHTEGGELVNQSNFGINARLPNLEKRWQLRFTSYDEEEAERDLQQRRIRTAPRQREYGAGLFFLRNLGNVKTTFQPRVEFKDPLEMSYVLRFESAAEQKSTRLAPRLELFADPEKGTGQFFSLEFVTPITERINFVLNNEEEYRENGNYFLTNHGISFDYAFADDKGTGISFLFGANNRPTYHLETFSIGTPLAHEVYRQRFKYFFTPFIQFAKGNHFKGKVGASFNLELTF